MTRLVLEHDYQRDQWDRLGDGLGVLVVPGEEPCPCEGDLRYQCCHPDHVAPIPPPELVEAAKPCRCACHRGIMARTSAAQDCGCTDGHQRIEVAVRCERCGGAGTGFALDWREAIPCPDCGNSRIPMCAACRFPNGPGCEKCKFGGLYAGLITLGSVAVEALVPIVPPNDPDFDRDDEIVVADGTAYRNGRHIDLGPNPAQHVGQFALVVSHKEFHGSVDVVVRCDPPWPPPAKGTRVNPSPIPRCPICGLLSSTNPHWRNECPWSHTKDDTA